MEAFALQRRGRARPAPCGRRRSLLAGLLLACCACASAQSLQATAAQVKAAYLLKFPGFVEWPEGPAAVEAAFVVAVADADDVLHALQDLGRTARVMGRPVQVLRLGRDDGAPTGHLLYLGGSARETTRLVARARAQGALVVGDGPRALADGAALQFAESDGRVRFYASPDNAARAGLKLSARLLSVAARVEGGP